MSFTPLEFGRTFSLGSREVYAPASTPSSWVAGGDGLKMQRALELGEYGIRTQGVKIGAAGLWGVFPDVEIDPDGVATLREILPQTTGQKVGTAARPWGQVHSVLFYGSGAQLTGVEKTSNRGAPGGYCPLDSDGLVPAANLGPYFPNVITVDADYAVRDIDTIISVDTSGGDVELTLDSVLGAAQQIHTIKNLGTGNVTITPDAFDEIDGQPNLVLSLQWSAVTIFCDGQFWLIA